ncbi:MAG TPA: carboxypeptidase regulatory-like domain-containing protein, partial [Gemmatimonadales bacterium]|nr:carboxypeptidase regulatory-like domain-containing protein [Gemmatimonadales bacterium]
LGRSRPAITDRAGYFRHVGLAAGSYLLQVRKTGYVTMTWEVAAADDTAVVHLLRVHPLRNGDTAGVAGTAVVRARVLERGTGTPIAGAEVLVDGRPQPALTDAGGYVRHTGLAPVAHILRVRKVGYEPVTFEVVAAEDSTVEHVLEMRRAEIPEMDTVLVEASPGQPGAYWLRGFEARRTEGRRGQFVTRPEIEARRAATLGDLLRTLNGLRTSCTPRGCSIRMTRTNCRPSYFADGFPADATTVERMPVNDVYGVEVYDLFEVPVELQRSELRCGVIAVWTRRGPPPPR